MLRVAFVLLLIRFTLATFQLRMPRSQLQLQLLYLSRSLSLYLPCSFISLTIAALCLFWRLLHSLCSPLSPRMQHVAHRQQLPPQHPVLRPSPPLGPAVIACSFLVFRFLFRRVIFNSFTFCTSALCVTNCFCVSVFTIVLIHFWFGVSPCLPRPPSPALPPPADCTACLIKCTLSVVESLHHCPDTFIASRPSSHVLPALPASLPLSLSICLSLSLGLTNFIL